MIICEPLKDKTLLSERLKDTAITRVLVIFWHGLGDLVMFLEPYKALKAAYPHIHFDLGLPKGLCYEQGILDECVLMTGDEVNKDEVTQTLPYDLVAKITFPMNEHQTEFTKGEWCCIHELGIDPVWGHGQLAPCESRLVCVHYNITCLPDSANPDEEAAKQVWDDVLAAGFIPLECHFEHIFHNPVNLKFPFIDASVRRARAEVASLVGLIRSARAFIGVVSGPFHVALSVLPPERVFLLEKDFKAGSFSKLPFATADVRNYQGEVKPWLEAMKEGQCTPTI